MAVNREAYLRIRKELGEKKLVLVAVSKTKPIADIRELYELGHRDFGENYVQEMVEKHQHLPSDIRWHFIGHLQSNKVKYIAPFVHLVHGIDSSRLLKEVSKQAAKHNRVIDCLLQVHIAQEETKFGLNEQELDELMTALKNETASNARVAGLMGMASFTGDMEKVRLEFHYLSTLFDRYFHDGILSMGMSSDYKVAIEEGSNMVRIGSMIFGER